MDDLDARVEALLAAPLGCAFLLAVDESRLTPAQAAEPGTTFAAAARAISETEIWHGDTHEEEVAQIVARAQRLRDLSRAILEEPEASWWFDPPDLRHQLCVWLLDQESSPDPSVIRSSGRATDRFERYAQKPRTVWTSTLVSGEACMRTFIDADAGDWVVRDYPLRQWHLSAGPSARVYEVTGPDTWHALCLRYPVRVGDTARSFQGKWPDPERLTVDWQAAAKDWDAVHLTFGGLLTSEQVPRETAEGWSVMWGWASEMTVWLRWAFDSVERLPDHERTERHQHISFPFIRTTPSPANKPLTRLTPASPIANLPEPPAEAPNARLLTFDGEAELAQAGVHALVQWGPDRASDRTSDEPPAWPAPLVLDAQASAVVRFDTPAQPTLVEVTTFDRLDESGAPTDVRAHAKCETAPIFEDAPACEMTLVERDGAPGWELPLAIPEDPGRYYLSVWAQWIPPVRPEMARRGIPRAGGRVFLAGWPFAIERNTAEHDERHP